MDAWYAHPVYARYWQHYQQAMNWHHRHRRAYSKALQAAYGPALYPVFPTATPRYADWHGEERDDRAHGRTKSRTWGREQAEGRTAASELFQLFRIDTKLLLERCGLCSGLGLI